MKHSPMFTLIFSCFGVAFHNLIQYAWKELSLWDLVTFHESGRGWSKGSLPSACFFSALGQNSISNYLWSKLTITQCFFHGKVCMNCHLEISSNQHCWGWGMRENFTRGNARWLVIRAHAQTQELAGIERWLCFTGNQFPFLVIHQRNRMSIPSTHLKSVPTCRCALNCYLRARAKNKLSP